MTKNCPSFTRHQSLEATQVIPLFDSSSTIFTTTPPFKPKAGEVYVLKLDIGHERNNSNQINETFDDSQNKQKKKSLNNSNLANTLNETKVNADISSRPRNIEQIRNIKRRLARRLVASTDEISELYHFASETPNYIVRFTLIPNVVVVAFSNESMHEFNLLLDYPDLLSQQAAIITFDSS
ncbi:unnamed protein product [Rotaria magnacalcarata]|uniref:Uncharacterized protein n=1 Tax=Rotaria magnacalcarata TaxID=392030 RepID=A0A8S2KBB6_9BILA|nr:unnamed protein product [Rotaria magnacalcarata]